MGEQLSVVMNLKSRFAERPVFVTGADGFVKSHLTEQFVGYEKFNETTGWGPEVSWREGAKQTIKYVPRTKKRGTDEWIGSNRMSKYNYVN